MLSHVKHWIRNVSPDTDKTEYLSQCLRMHKVSKESGEPFYG